MDQWEDWWWNRVSEGYAHYSEGTAGDGNIYVDDDGCNVKLEKLGRRDRVRSDGVREVPIRGMVQDERKRKGRSHPD